MRVVLIIFFLFSALHLGIALNLPSTIPEQNFPYKDILYKYFSLYPLTPFANFDGYQYISIARDGYSELQQSYFPLYPGLVQVVSLLFSKNYILGGVIVSWLFFLLGLVYFYKLAGLLLKNNQQVMWAVVFLAAFPTAFYYQVIYTESLFLFLSAGALYYLYSRKYFWAAVFAVFASLTKIQGVLLIIPFFLVIIGFGRFLPTQVLPYIHKHVLHIFLAFAPLYGLLLYSAYLGITHGDPLYYYHAQSAFGAERSVDKIILLPQVLFRYIKIFLTTPQNFVFWISVLEFMVCLSFVGVIGYELFKRLRQKKKDMQHISLQSYSLVVLLLPTLTGTLTSLPRYALISFGFFIVLAKLKSTYLKALLAIFFLVFHVLLFIYFLKGYFVS